MSEETTHNLPDGSSFEERVFARFDAIDASLRDLNSRVQTLESESERRAVETKPIWERVLAEIVALGQKVDALERKVNLLVLDMMTLRADQVRLEGRMDKLESEPAR
jgi:outer membrane murein-binding lipoprotein Lpp